MSIPTIVFTMLKMMTSKIKSAKMKFQLLRRTLVLCIGLLACLTSVTGQTSSFYKKSNIVPLGSSTAIVLNKHFGQGTNIEKNIFSYKLTFIAEYTDPTVARNGNLSSSTSLSVSYSGAPHLNRVVDGGNDNRIVLQVDGSRTIAAYSIDLMSEVNLNSNFNDIGTITITPVVIGDQSNLTLRVEEDVEYGLRVGNRTVRIVSEVENGIHSILTWDNGGIDYPLYEIAMLKVTILNPVVDGCYRDCNYNCEYEWDKARKYIVKGNRSVNSSEVTEKIGLIDGNGFYMWKVRPIGGYEAGGLSNSKNYGRYSEIPYYNTTSKTICPSDAYYYVGVLSIRSNDIGYRNAMYSKTYTEAGAHESITYADKLLNPRQTQTYVPRLDGNEYTLASQTIKDYLGRPVVVTMPVPVSGFDGEYKEGLATIAGTQGELYTAEDFDEDSKRNNPSPMKVGVDYDYYSNANPNVDIPDAGGYPFSRTLFTEDGSGKVLKESGVGTHHRLNPDKVNEHVTSYSYAKATADELFELFGSEAPKAENVMKQIVKSPDGIYTVSYMSAEGKALATSIMINDENRSTFNDISTGAMFSSKIDRINNNIQQADAEGNMILYSSGQVNLLAPSASDVTIKYYLNKEELESNCGLVDVEVDYSPEVRMYYGSKSNEVSVSLTEGATNEGVTEYSITFNNPGNYEPGTYIIEKYLNPFNTTTQNPTTEENIRKYIDPLYNLIDDWYSNVSCPSTYEIFWNNLKSLQEELDPNNPNPIDFTDDIYQPHLTLEFTAFVESILNESEVNNTYSISTAGVELSEPDFENLIEETELTTPCCGTQTINYSFDFEIPCTRPATVADVGFEQDIRDFLINEKCFPEDDANGEMQKIMKGWPEGTFDAMVWHMLNDQYDATNKAEAWVDTRELPEFECAENEEELEVLYPSVNYYDPYYPGNANKMRKKHVQYNCYDLKECLYSILYAVPSYCEGETGGNSYALFDAEELENDEDGVITPGDQMDQKDEDDGEGNNTHDDFLDQERGFTLNPMKIIERRQIRKLSEEFDDMEREAVEDFFQEEPALDEDGEVITDPGGDPIMTRSLNFHFVDMFLECTGYKFAKILTPFDPNPLPADARSSYSYHTTDSYINNIYAGNGTESRELLLNEGIKLETYNAYDFSGIDETYKYKAYSNWLSEGQAEEGSSLLEKKFKYIPNPVFAFKYCIYPDAGEFPEFEGRYCFDDLNDCYQVDGNGKIIIDAGTGKPYRTPCGGVSSVAVEYPNQAILYADHAQLGNSAIQGELFPSSNRKYRVETHCNFLDNMCPYNYTHWGNNEIYRFFRLLSTESHNTQLGEEYTSDEAASMEQVITNYIGRIGDECSNMKVPQLWYDNSDFGVPINENLMLAFDGTGFYTESEYLTAFSIYEDIIPMDELVPLETSPASISPIELVMSKIQLGCVENCDGEARRSEFRKAIYDAMRESCYAVGSLNPDNTCGDNGIIITPQEIEELINALVSECKLKCRLTTYSCDVENCRNIDNSKNEIGLDDMEVNVRFGVFASNITDPTDGTVNNYICYNCTYNDNFPLYRNATNGRLFEVALPTGTSENWYEWMHMQEAMYWKPEVALPNRCWQDSGYAQSFYSNMGNSYVTKETFVGESANANSTFTTSAKQINVSIEPEPAE